MTETLRDYEDLEPCGDGGCIMLTGPARGMTTNGGCQHLQLRPVEMRRLLLRLAMERQQLTNEADALRAEGDALRTIARDVAIAEASIASCVIHGAPPVVFREHRLEWQRALAALRGWLAG